MRKEPLHTQKGNVAIISIFALLICVVVFGFCYFFTRGGLAPIHTFNVSGEYQAVFLSNNQVYFGKFHEDLAREPSLSNVYYLQVADALQQNTAGNINLIKLGGELHGPEDRIILNRDHILFVEDLKPDSRVVQLIKGMNK